ncbi:Transcriptional regulator, AraC family OS=Tsukamurella paurometabola (strain ATCC 8368 / DSM/ CCUG 35730 / CIP 100753 / JCM 10117 / KCTC 9821 / NBRC 16120/ NCIMB 702349 / NCTC 13040) OX=521096 GN=Tpau_4079 PE=4 SV=1 [Tsukamurella paurometabola]|uniref:Transcriptional regulator, AraC family n=1 Tax=Tsukamurella paurometabola (strain ATCC 8368 / DSM 20162 / CCUG 35730 / CIP 100753 / JCM 10117 / KCTC 9821 / NBRC 16120 / NCIMB 702349 / NCTC 13040) TaxID=521096 RepID=D5UNF4_TSUPD|nr:helix-turn-helix domain-containing protein [Tsukamurella paurometabola]ADG80649.1 transcriptional regulator, AraC family [Tsukamurella paurometabola DSM 20162]SUP40429.1 Regulatory protein soxS [Tsukamurella paurometabola]
MHTVAVLLLEPIVGFDAAIPPLCFSEAKTEAGQPLYRVITCGLDRNPVAATGGYAVTPEAGPEVLPFADTVIIPGTKIPGPRTDGTLPDEVRAALRSIRPGTRIVSICTGAFVLAAAGLLDGRSVTTHWKYGAHLHRMYPRVGLVDHVLFTDDGDVLTSAGLAAGLDLCLHLIRKDHGAAMANKVARYCVIPPGREGTQAQFVDVPVPASGAGSTVAVREWAQQHLDENLAVDQLARRAGLSVRTFNRRFREETGETPGAWILRRRLDRARLLLETSDLSVDAVARDSGLGTGASLRAHLRRDTGMTPLGYRRVFQEAPGA